MRVNEQGTPLEKRNQTKERKTDKQNELVDLEKHERKNWSNCPKEMPKMWSAWRDVT